jgi:hypothetical protein
MCFKIVAPSLVITTSPVPVCICMSSARMKICRHEIVSRGGLTSSWVIIASCSPSCPCPLVPSSFAPRRKQLCESVTLHDIQAPVVDPPFAAFMFDSLTSVGFPCIHHQLTIHHPTINVQQPQILAAGRSRAGATHLVGEVTVRDALGRGRCCYCRHDCSCWLRR